MARFNNLSRTAGLLTHAWNKAVHAPICRKTPTSIKQRATQAADMMCTARAFQARDNVR